MSSITHVEGFKYLAAATGVPNFEQPKSRVFIPDYQLDIGDGGSILKTNRHATTFASEQAYWSWCQTRKSGESDRSIRENADKKALTPIQLPKELVERIQKIYEDRIALEQNTRKVIKDLESFW